MNFRKIIQSYGQHENTANSEENIPDSANLDRIDYNFDISPESSNNLINTESIFVSPISTPSNVDNPEVCILPLSYN